jgi:hypothetical protein
VGSGIDIFFRLSPCGRGRHEVAGEGCFEQKNDLIMEYLMSFLNFELSKFSAISFIVLETNQLKTVCFKLFSFYSIVKNTPHPQLRCGLSHKGRGEKMCR